MEFNKNDIEKLDYILNEVYNGAFSFTVSDLQKKYNLTDENGYGTINIETEYEREFERLMSIMKSYNACYCSFKEDAQYVKRSENTKQFIEQGGFKKQYEIFTENNKRKELLHEKSLSDAKLTSKRLKVFPYVFGMSLISFVFSIYTIITNQNKQTHKALFEQKIQQLQTELLKVQSKLKTKVEKNNHRDKQILNLEKNKKINQK